MLCCAVLHAVVDGRGSSRHRLPPSLGLPRPAAADFALCCPSRTTILTGQCAHNTGVSLPRRRSAGRQAGEGSHTPTCRCHNQIEPPAAPTQSADPCRPADPSPAAAPLQVVGVGVPNVLGGFTRFNAMGMEQKTGAVALQVGIRGSRRPPACHICLPAFLRA